MKKDTLDKIINALFDREDIRKIVIEFITENILLIY